MDLDANNEQCLISKTWAKNTEAAWKTGYRDGIEDGAESVLQKNFDHGYIDGFRNAFILGQYEGLSTILPQNTTHPKEIGTILKQTKEGHCYICTLKNEEAEKNSFESILGCQQKHFEKTFTILHNYFKPIMESHGVNIDYLKKELEV